MESDILKELKNVLVRKVVEMIQNEPEIEESQKTERKIERTRGRRKQEAPQSQETTQNQEATQDQEASLSIPPSYDVYQNFSTADESTYVKQTIGSNPVHVPQPTKPPVPPRRSLSTGSTTEPKTPSPPSNTTPGDTTPGDKPNANEPSNSQLNTDLSELIKQLLVKLQCEQTSNSALDVSARNSASIPSAASSSVTYAKTNMKHAQGDGVKFGQIEELYANLFRFNFLGNHNMKTVKTDPGMGLYSTAASTQQSLLTEKIHEIERLKEKIKQLELQLERSNKQTSTIYDATERREDHLIQSLKFDLRRDRPMENYYANVNERNANPKLPLRPYPTRPIDVKQLYSTFEWTISDYYQNLDMERRGKIKNVVSEPFYIGQFGYRVCLDAYLNGDHQHRCMSLYLRVVMGQFDQFLRWPTTLGVRFTVVNQDESGQGVSISNGSPRHNPFEFQQPTGQDSDCGNAWGLIEFVSHEDIHTKSFIKDGQLRIQVTICVLSQPLTDEDGNTASSGSFGRLSVEDNTKVP